MDKNLLWNEDADLVYGSCDAMNKEEFIEAVKIQHVEITGETLPLKFKVTKEHMICTADGVSAETVMPLSETDVSIEKYWVCKITVE